MISLKHEGGMSVLNMADRFKKALDFWHVTGLYCKFVGKKNGIMEESSVGHLQSPDAVVFPLTNRRTLKKA